MSYQKYQAEDFASDPKFREWVLSPGPELNYFWEKWLLNNPDKKHQVQQAKLIVLSFAFQEVQFEGKEKAELLKKIEIEIARKNAVSGVNVKTVPLHRQYQSDNYTSYGKVRGDYAWLKVAVVLFAVLVTSFYFIKNILDPAQTTIKQVVIINKTTAKGQRLPVRLPDGSLIILNSESSLSYPEIFTGLMREVQLSGEAFFEVVPDTVKPFIVNSSGFQTEVLGTSFNINAYPEHKKVTVALVSGRVKVHSPQVNLGTVDLKPGEAADIDLSSGKMIKENFDYQELINWKDGILYFKEVHINEVFQKLEQWYGVEIVAESIPGSIKPISGSFKNEHLLNVLQSISYTVNFDYKITGEKIDVKFK